jgi:hypothetical protein
MEGLRHYATNPKLCDKEILKEFAMYNYDIAPESDAVCICKKEGLRHMYFMHNKNMTDIIDRATTGTFIVGKFIAQWPRELLFLFKKAQK